MTGDRDVHREFVGILGLPTSSSLAFFKPKSKSPYLNNTMDEVDEYLYGAEDDADSPLGMLISCFTSILLAVSL